MAEWVRNKGHFWKSQLTAAKGTLNMHSPYCHIIVIDMVDLHCFIGAFQLLQLQEDVRRQFKMDGSGPENDVESHLRLNRETLMNSLWKLNVVDIEVTLLHVCQLVSLDQNYPFLISVLCLFEILFNFLNVIQTY